MPVIRCGRPACNAGCGAASFPAANTTTPPFATYAREASIMRGMDACSSSRLNEVMELRVPQELLMIMAPALAARYIMSASCASLAVISPFESPTLKLTTDAL
jgi:hypothetical protein